MNWGVGANCFLLKAVNTYGKDWESVSTALQMISRTFLRDEKLQDFSKQSCSLQYNYIMASTRQRNLQELDEDKLFDLALDYYTTQRREKLHTTRLELLKNMKIAEEDAEKLREGRYSEIPMSRLTIYRKRCRAFGIADVIGSKLGLEPLSPGTESENQAIRENISVPELFNCEIGEEIKDANAGTWYPVRTDLRSVFSEKEHADMEASICKFVQAQAILAQRIGTDIPEDDASSVDTTSSIQTHPEIPVEPALHTHSPPEKTDGQFSSNYRTRGAVSRMPPLSPTSSAMVSDTDTMASPLVTQSINSSPGLLGSDFQSPVVKSGSKKRLKKHHRKVKSAVAVPRPIAEYDSAFSPSLTEGSTFDEPRSPAQMSVLAHIRRWRRGLLAALSTACSHRHAYVFMHPVTEDIAPGYSSVVFQPVDLTLVRRRLEAALGGIGTGGQQTSTSNPAGSPTQIVSSAATGFIRDLMLMFVNARMYNSQNHEVHKMAGDMFDDVMTELHTLWSVLAEDIPDFPSLPAPTKPPVPPGPRTAGRPVTPNLQQSTTTVSPVTVQQPLAKSSDTNITKATPSSTRQLKRPHPEFHSSSIGSPPRKRHQSSGSDASTHAARSK